MRSPTDLPPGTGHQRIRISAVSPAGQRRRRQAQRRSACCCAGMLLFCLLIVVVAFRGVIGRALTRGEDEDAQAARQILFPLEVQTAKTQYLRYELIPVTVRVVDPQGKPVSDAPPEVVVRHNGEPVQTVGHYGERVRLDWDAEQQAWVGHWPPGWNPEPGPYEVFARTEIDPAQWSWAGATVEEEGEPQAAGEAWAVALAPFELVGRPRADLPRGMCVATWEFDIKEAVTGPTGQRGDWRNLFDWVEYMGADTFWFRGAVTDPPSGGLTLEAPFKPINIEALPRLGQEAHARGIRFGAWAVAYATYGGNKQLLPKYDYSLDISRSTGQIRSRDYVSLLDERRVDHIANFFRSIQQSEYVDMAGLDYMRTNPGSGGYELAAGFTDTMPVDLPDNWASMGRNARMVYVAKKVEEEWRADGDPQFYDAWNWYRAHLGAEIVQRILHKSGITKPTWIFMLSWWHGMQHGQDPIMFTDAGISMLAPMLYQIPNRTHFNIMVRDWHEYLRAGQVNLVPGDQVDFYWHQKTTNPPAPAELYDRIVTAHRQYINGEATVGAFWHDINRAMTAGNLGPYTSREWALAGAAAFSVVRDTWKVYPLHAELEAPDKAGIADAFTVKVRLANTTNQPVTGVRISLCDTPHLVGPQLTGGEGQRWNEPFTEVGTVPAGQTVEVPVQVRITQPDSARLNKTMLALRITWAEGDFAQPVRTDLPRMIVLMKYITGV